MNPGADFSSTLNYLISFQGMHPNPTALTSEDMKAAIEAYVNFVFTGDYTFSYYAPGVALPGLATVRVNPGNPTELIITPNCPLALRIIQNAPNYGRVVRLEMTEGYY